MTDICVRRYPQNYDLKTTERWLKQTVLPQSLIYYAARTDDAFCVSMVAVAPWTPSDFRCEVCIIGADVGHVWQCIPLLKASIAWARGRKCVSWHCDSATSQEIGPLMKRVGATAIEPRYRMELSP